MSYQGSGPAKDGGYGGGYGAGYGQFYPRPPGQPRPPGYPGQPRPGFLQQPNATNMMPPQGVPPPHPYDAANFGAHTAVQQQSLPPVAQNYNRQQPYPHGGESHGYRSVESSYSSLHSRADNRKSQASDDADLKREKSYSKSSDKQRSSGLHDDQVSSRDSHPRDDHVSSRDSNPREDRAKSCDSNSRDKDGKKSARQNSGGDREADRLSRLDIDDLLQDERLKNVLFAGISKATAKLEQSLKPTDKKSENYANVDDSSSRHKSQQAAQTSSSADILQKPRSILKRKTGEERVEIESKVSTDSFNKLSALEKTLHLLHGKARVEDPISGSEKGSRGSENPSYKPKGALRQLESYIDSGDDNEYAEQDPTKKQSKIKKIVPSTQPFWSVDAVPAVKEKDKDSELPHVQEQLYEQWRQSVNRSTKARQTASKEQDMSKVDQLFKKTGQVHNLASSSQAKKVGDNGELDSTVQNILQSIGFNFDLSKRMQELARQKKKQDVLHTGMNNQSASFLEQSEGLVQDVRAAVFSNRQEKVQLDSLIKKARASMQTRPSYERSASPDVFSTEAQRSKKTGSRKGGSPKPDDGRSRMGLESREIRSERTLEKLKSQGWEQLSPDEDEMGGIELRKISEKTKRLPYEKNAEIRQQSFSRKREIDSPPRSKVLLEEAQKVKKSVPRRSQEKSLLLSGRFRDEPKDEYFYPDEGKSSKAAAILAALSSKWNEISSSGSKSSLKLPLQLGSSLIDSLRGTSKTFHADDKGEHFIEISKVTVPSKSDIRVVSQSPIFRKSQSPEIKITRKRSASPLLFPLSKERRVFDKKEEYSDLLQNFLKRSLKQIAPEISQELGLNEDSYYKSAVKDRLNVGDLLAAGRAKSPIMSTYLKRGSVNTSRDRQASRSPDRGISRSSDRHKSLSPDRRKAMSPERRKFRSPERRNSMSPDRRKSMSPDRRRSRSPNKWRSRSPEKQKPITLEKRRSGSPDRGRCRSPDRRRSRSPDRQRSRSPYRWKSRSPDRRRSRSPVRLKSISLDRRRSRSPDRRRSRSPDRQRSRSPYRWKSRSPDRQRSRSPDRQRSRSPVRLKSISLDRRRSRSLNRRMSRSPDRRRSRSPGKRKSRSLDRRRSRSPDKNRSRSPDRWKSRSPDRRRSRSPERRRSRSPEKQKSILVDRHGSRSPVRRRSRSPDRRRSRSPDRRRSRSPDKRRSRSPDRRRSRSPDRRRSRSPDRRRSRSPGKRKSRSLDRRRSRSPDKNRSRSPDRWKSRSPDRRRSRSPERRRSRSPEKQKSILVDRHGSRSPVRRRSRSPDRRRSRSPDRRRSRSPDKRRSRSPDRRRSRSPDRRRSRSPARLKARSPLRARSRSPARRKSRSPGRRLSRSPGRLRSRSPKRQKSRTRSPDRRRKLPEKRYSPVRERLRAPVRNESSAFRGQQPLKQRQNANKDRNTRQLNANRKTRFQEQGQVNMSKRGRAQHQEDDQEEKLGDFPVDERKVILIQKQDAHETDFPHLGNHENVYFEYSDSESHCCRYCLCKFSNKKQLYQHLHNKNHYINDRKKYPLYEKASRREKTGLLLKNKKANMAVSVAGSKKEANMAVSVDGSQKEANKAVSVDGNQKEANMTVSVAGSQKEDNMAVSVTGSQKEANTAVSVAGSQKEDNRVSEAAQAVGIEMSTKDVEGHSVEAVDIDAEVNFVGIENRDLEQISDTSTDSDINDASQSRKDVIPIENVQTKTSVQSTDLEASKERMPVDDTEDSDFDIASAFNEEDLLEEWGDQMMAIGMGSHSHNNVYEPIMESTDSETSKGRMPLEDTDVDFNIASALIEEDSLEDWDNQMMAGWVGSHSHDNVNEPIHVNDAGQNRKHVILSDNVKTKTSMESTVSKASKERMPVEDTDVDFNITSALVEEDLLVERGDQMITGGVGSRSQDEPEITTVASRGRRRGRKSRGGQGRKPVAKSEGKVVVDLFKLSPEIVEACGKADSEELSSLSTEMGLTSASPNKPARKTRRAKGKSAVIQRRVTRSRTKKDDDVKKDVADEEGSEPQQEHAKSATSSVTSEAEPVRDSNLIQLPVLKLQKLTDCELAGHIQPVTEAAEESSLCQLPVLKPEESSDSDATVTNETEDCPAVLQPAGSGDAADEAKGPTLKHILTDSSSKDEADCNVQQPSEGKGPSMSEVDGDVDDTDSMMAAVSEKVDP